MKQHSDIINDRVYKADDLKQNIRKDLALR